MLIWQGMMKKIKNFIEWLKELFENSDRKEIDGWESDVLGELDNGNPKN